MAHLKTGVSRKQGTANFTKNEHFLPPGKLTYVRMCAYHGIRNVRFLENLTCFVFLKHPFWDAPFCLVTDDSWNLEIRWKLNEAVLRLMQALLKV